MGRRSADQPGYDQLIELMVADYGAGMSRRTIAQKYGLSLPTVKGWLTRAGVELRSGAEQSRKHNADAGSSRRKSIDRDILEHLFCVLGWSKSRCALFFGVDHTTIGDRVAQWNLTRTVEQQKLARSNTVEIRKQTCRSLYGGDSPQSDAEVRARTTRTNIQKYGVANPFGSPHIRELIRRTNLERYGVENPLFDPQRAARVGQAVSAAAQEKWSLEAKSALSSPEGLVDYMNRTGRNTVPLIRFGLGVSEDAVRARVVLFGLQDMLDTSYHTSAWEREVGDTIKSWGIPVEKARGILPGLAGRGRDVDWFWAEHKIGVECNGSLNHSEARRGRTYHQNKTKAALDGGISLYHVFSYEWADPRQRRIVESQLQGRFGLIAHAVGARSCDIVEVSPQEATAFLEQNHLQGKVGSKVRYVLRYEGELLALMTFGKPREQRRDDPVQWELIRYAVKAFSAVPGGAERLFRHFQKHHHPESVVSYSDAAKTSGQMYSRLGFDLVGWTAPEYVWWKNEKTVLRRYQCMKHKLVTAYQGIIPDVESMSEAQIMHSLGYQRIYGCGSKVWVWRAQ